MWVRFTQSGWWETVPKWAVQGESCRTRHKGALAERVEHALEPLCVPRIRGCRTYGRLPVSASPGSGTRVEWFAGEGREAGKVLRNGSGTGRGWRAREDSAYGRAVGGCVRRGPRCGV